MSGSSGAAHTRFGRQPPKSSAGLAKGASALGAGPKGAQLPKELRADEVRVDDELAQGAGVAKRSPTDELAQGAGVAKRSPTDELAQGLV